MSQMFMEKVKSEGLAHLSYILGHQGQAAVIDPRRDHQVYIDIARKNESQITHIFETHRNEDYVVGSLDLARRTGAEIYHGRAIDFAYGTPVAEGDVFALGDIEISVLETPGHTFESISLVLRDKNFGHQPIAVFTGDLLFIGSVGRTDFFPDRHREVAGLQYDGIFEKILPLGDQVIVFPAHGAGSVCGSGMSEREFSTLGYERENNPGLKLRRREEFVEFKLEENPKQPPYFRKMEEYNQFGPPPMEFVPDPDPLSAGRFEKEIKDGMQVVDMRSPEAFAGAFIPGSLAIPLKMVPAYAGYFLSYDKKIGLVLDSPYDIDVAVRHLIRLGYDHITGYLEGGMHSWETAGMPYDRIAVVHVDELVRRYNTNYNFTLLDVREEEELKQVGKFPGALHIFLGELPDRIREVPRERPVTTFCGSGMRAIIAASILKQYDFEQVEDNLGSMAACKAAGCPTEEG
ncbi:MAG: MBL fold metallo-hydrolase [Thermodesulfobacteriota bacterium]